MDPASAVLERLTTALEQLTVREPTRPRIKVSAPVFDGSGDVELFIRQFLAVAEASE